MPHVEVIHAGRHRDGGVDHVPGVLVLDVDEGQGVRQTESETPSVLPPRRGDVARTHVAGLVFVQVGHPGGWPEARENFSVAAFEQRRRVEDSSADNIEAIAGI
ncbi:hypothetical protein [Ornithinimicrobium ciconiae]|uniref:hypothetical protein n=1 Tax=Ornithinimicrobium ciconiae TaxID=2594265 RepID=UPI001D1858CD|nr:hypothetical protein [Ornithinimicrobium ciconiae]